MKTLLPILLAAGALCVSSAAGQAIVIPNANENARGTTQLNTLVRNSGNARTYMLGIPASELGAVPPGSVITGVSFRSQVFTSNPALWPTADIGFTNYEVSIGLALPLASWTGTFAANFLVPPLLVRTGPMTITPGLFTHNSALPAPLPNSFGEFYWDFHKAYLYTGGDLALLFSHPGSNSSTFVYLDCVNSSAATGVGYTASSFQAASGSSTTFCIPRLHIGYGAGCPGTGGRAPVLVKSNDITGGGSAYIAVGGGLSGSAAVYLVGLGRMSIPLPGGCTLLLTPAPLMPLAAGLDIHGRHSLKAALPAGVAGSIFLQAFVADPVSALGLSATNGVQLLVRP